MWTRSTDITPEALANERAILRAVSDVAISTIATNIGVPIYLGQIVPAGVDALELGLVTGLRAVQQPPRPAFSALHRSPRPKKPAVQIIQVGDGGHLSRGRCRRIASHLKSLTSATVQGAILAIDVTGSSLAGATEVYDALMDLRHRLPTICHCFQATSGGYLIATAGRVLSVSPLSIIGGVGLTKLAGISDTIGSTLGLRSVLPDGLEECLDSRTLRGIDQRRTLILHELMMRRIETARPDAIRGLKAADGRIFDAPSAIAAGLADSVESLGSALDAICGDQNLPVKWVPMWPVAAEPFVGRFSRMQSYLTTYPRLG